MKRKLLSVLLTLCLAFSLLPTAALAEGPDTNLPAADENGVITLTNDVTITGQQWVVDAGETLTLDLNGHTVKISKYTAEKGQVLVKGTLTVKDSSEAGTGKICSDYTGTSGRVIDVTGGTLYIQGGTITTEGMTKNGSAVYVGGSGTVEMIAGTVTGSKANDYVMNVRSGACTITGGKVLGGATNNYAVYGANSTTVEISGNAEINATKAVTANATTANIKISGGTYTGALDVKAGAITGGTFSTDVSAYVAGGYVQKGNSIETLQEDEAEAKIKEVLYPTLLVAIRNAKAGDTVTLLKNLEYNLTSNITISKNLTLDLNGHSITNSSTTKNDLYVAGGEVTITGTGSIIAPNSFGVSVVGRVSAKTWKPIKAVLTVGKDVSIEAGLPAVFITGYGAVVNVYGKLTGTGDYATIQGNGVVSSYYNYGGTEINIYDGAEVVSQNSDAMYVPQSGTINVYGGTVTGKSSGIGFKSGSLNVSGGTIKATGEDSTPTEGWSNGINASGAAIQVESNKEYIGNADHAKYSQFGDSVKISISDDAVIESVNGFAVYEYLAAGTTKTSVESLKITGGQFKSANGKTNIKISEQLDQSDAILISGGLFTANTNLTKHCAEGLMAVENKASTTMTTYPYTIGEVPDAAIDMTITEHTQPGATDGSVSESVTDKTAAEAVARSVTTDVASTAGAIEITDTEKKTAIQQLLADGQIELDENGNVTAPTGSSENVTVTIIKQPYLDVEVTALNSTAKELSLTIEPKYNLLATTDKDNSSKSVVVSTGNALTVTGEMEVTLALPNGFAAAGNKLSIKHTKGNSTVEYYTGTVSVENGNLYVTFTTKGFSPFTISAPAASIGETMYPTLAEAIAKAANGNTVKLEKNCTESVTVSGKSLTINKNDHEYDFAKVTVDSNSTKTVSGDGKILTITYTAPSSSSGSSGYYVSTPSKTENGTVTVSPRYADKGDTVTVTVKPDSGYVLETLTVTDKNGNELTLKDKGNGKYAFTMPSGKVEVKATFMEDNSVLNFFYDVPNDAYFYEAVKWAVKNGITDGVGNNLFAPEQPCTRAQIVTFLWRAAGSPEPKGAASGMTDVVSGSYYEKAVAWAIENGITTGTTTSTFSPDATCTRAQAVTFLARALNAKAASAAEFSDVPTDSYFADAVAWAAANGVTEGIGGGLFGSDNDCTRGQIVTFLYRAYNK